MALARDEAKLREDFDQIADLDVGDGWDHNSHYHGYLLRQLPGHIGEALDVGCGAGSFARLLARLSERVVAIDLSPRMVEVARSRSGRYPNVSYAVANANTWPFPEDRFDCVASITTLHHLPLAPILRKMSGALKPGGTLLVLDIYRAQNLADYLTDVAGFVASKAISLAEGSARPLRQTPALQLAWAEHGKWDVYPGPAEVRAACADAGGEGGEGAEAPALALLRRMAQAEKEEPMLDEKPATHGPIPFARRYRVATGGRDTFGSLSRGLSRVVLIGYGNLPG